VAFKYSWRGGEDRIMEWRVIDPMELGFVFNKSWSSSSDLSLDLCNVGILIFK
jgi:hypothetical protein